MQAAMLVGLINNAYIGLIIYLLLPGLFVLGLVLVPIAWRVRLRETGLDARELLRQEIGEGAVDSSSLTGAPIFKTVAVLTLINVVFLGAVSLQMLHFMDSARFCGTACHKVMNPEWTTYQASPHARVACVQCHVGKGVRALVSSKLNGVWQIVSATFNLYDRPIPTPVHQLRPARDTCEKCHWPAKFYGNRLVTRVSYGNDERSTPRYTTLNLKIDASDPATSGVHWHVGETNEVRYASVDDERKQMIWVEVRQSDGSYRRFANSRLAEREVKAESIRVMDCVDCHNRATHIYEPPERAVDAKIRNGEIDRTLPFIRREAVAAVTAGYPSRTAAVEGIRFHLEGFYRSSYPEQASAWRDRIDAAASALIAAYERNIHHEMNIDWGAYPTLLGHEDTDGCFRCHTDELEDADGQWIVYDCTLCHSILAEDEPEPYRYLEASDGG
jgi:hypothetical protein